MAHTPSALTEKQNKQTNSLLRTYFTSLFSMVLSCALLLGTTFAWFNDDTTSQGNEINSGILGADMLHAGVSLSQQPDHAVFPAGVWIPGQTVVQTVTVKNTGTLPMQYKLDFVPQTNVAKGAPLSGTVAELFTVLVKEGGLTAGERRTVSGPELLSLGGWSNPGTLADVMDISSSTALYNTGVVLEPGEEQDISIALCMGNPLDPEAVMGKTVSLYLKLEATQPIGRQPSLSGTEDLTGYEPEHTADVSVADTARTQTVTPDNIDRVNFGRNDTTYVFQGAFESISVPVSPGLEQVFDGSLATVTGAVSLRGEGEGSGSYAISGFTAGQVNVELTQARLQLLSNSCRQLCVTGEGLELTVHGNLVGGDAVDGAQEQTGSPDGICINVAGYDLYFTDNTVCAGESDVLTINGRQNEAEYADADIVNQLTAFTGNKLSAGGLNTVAIRVRSDAAFAPVGGETLSENAIKLITNVLREDAANFITVSEAVGQYKFGFNDFATNDVPTAAVDES